MKKSLLALAVSLAAVSGAHASWYTGADAGGNSNVGNGEAALVLWDSTTKSSYAQDLGVLFDNLLNGSAFGQNISLNSAALNTAFAGNYSNVQWTVIAASGHYTNADASAYETADYGWIQTGKASALPAPEADPQLQLDYIAQLLPKANQLLTTEGGAFNVGAVSANGVVTAVNGGVGYTSDFTDALFGNLPGVMQPSAYNGQTTNLWYIGMGDNDGTVPLNKILGTLTLNLSGSNGTLSLNSSAPSVPVPAAAWLLGSALAGLGGIARKRKQA